MKLGPVKRGQGDYLKCSIPDSLSYLLYRYLTHFQCPLGHWHQGPSWTTANISPQHCMQADLAKSCDLNLALKTENFIKHRVSEILHGISWLVQKVGFGSLLSHEAGSAAVTEIKTTFSPNMNLGLNRSFCMCWQNHVVRKQYNRYGAREVLKAPSDSTLLIIRSTVMKIKCFWEQLKLYCQRYHHQNLIGDVQTLNDFIICK